MYWVQVTKAEFHQRLLRAADANPELFNQFRAAAAKKAAELNKGAPCEEGDKSLKQQKRRMSQDLNVALALEEEVYSGASVELQVEVARLSAALAAAEAASAENEAVQEAELDDSAGRVAELEAAEAAKAEKEAAAADSAAKVAELGVLKAEIATRNKAEGAQGITSANTVTAPVRLPISKDESNMIFDSFDVDDSGSLDVNELVAKIAELKGRDVNGLNLEKIKQAWDSDGDGQVPPPSTTYQPLSLLYALLYCVSI